MEPVSLESRPDSICYAVQQNNYSPQVNVKRKQGWCYRTFLVTLFVATILAANVIRTVASGSCHSGNRSDR